MSAAQKPSVTSSLRIFMVMEAIRVIGGTALVSISSSWATQSRMPETSFSSLASSASVTASRARRAIRRTVARSTDMEGFLVASSARLAPRRASGNFGGSGLEGDAYVRHEHLFLAQRGDEFVGGLVQHREGPVMAGNDRVEIEETLAGERRRLGPHGEAVADGHEADLWRVDFADQRHVGEDRRIAHVINRLLPFRGDDEAATGAEIDRAAIDHMRGGMPGRDEGEVEIAEMERAPGIAAIDLVHALAGEIGRKLVHGDERGVGLLTDAQRISAMVLVPVGERDMGDDVDHLVEGNPGLLERGVAGEKRIHQDAA